MRSATLGPLVSSHPIRAWGWVLASLLGLAMSAGFLLYALGGHKEHSGTKQLVGAAVTATLSVWFFIVWTRLRGTQLDLFEGGLVFRERTGESTVLWSDIESFEARYAPGAKRANVDVRRMTSIVVRTKTGKRISIPREIREFRRLRALFSSKSSAAWREVVAAHILERD